MTQFGNSEGRIAEGVQGTNGNLEELGRERMDALRTRNEMIERENRLKEQAEVELLTSQVEDVQAELRDVDEAIEQTQAQVRLSSCEVLTLCSSCTLRPDCVWCSSESICVAGDDFGPILGECTDFTHNCACQDVQTCSECLTLPQNCGWCPDFNHCLPLNSLCRTSFSTNCTQNNPISADFSDELTAQRSLTSSLTLQFSLKSELNRLQAQLLSILQEQNPAIPTSNYQNPSSDFDNYPNIVENTAENERKF